MAGPFPRRFDQVGSEAVTVQEQDRSVSGMLVPRPQRGAQSSQGSVFGRKVIAKCSRWARTDAQTATGANQRVQRHVVARGCDRSGRAEVKATCATQDLAARVSAVFAAYVNV